MPHIHEQIDFTAEVFVVNKNKVLLRKHDKYGIWLSVGGHIELHEDPQEAAIREVKEEVGLEVILVPTNLVLDTNPEKYKHLITPAFMNRHIINEKHEHITLVFFARTNEEKIIQGDKEISKDCRWFSLEELQDLKEGISDTVKEYAKAALMWISKEHDLP